MTNLERLCSQIAREEDAFFAPGYRRALVRHRLLSTNISRRTAPLSPWTGLVVAASCALVIVAGAFLWQTQHIASLTATVGESRSPISTGSWLNAPETSSIPLRFSDGTRVDIAPHSRMRLLELGVRGANLALESGRAGVDVAHGNNRHWELRAGPFIVNVTGTRFDLSWSPNEDQFELALSEGQVELAGCGFGAGRKLAAGQTVRASCRDNLVEIAYSRVTATSAVLTAPPLPDTPEAVPAATSDVSRQAQASASSVSSPVPAIVDWIALAKQGKYADALEAVNRLGFLAECARVHADELALLGDTARHARDPKQARQAFALLRQRFPGTNQAGLAAFSLGVLEFDHARAYSKAADWFRTYIEENPAGPLSREARGRLMEARHREGSGEARNLATDYLRDYPAGPHAELAQRIVQPR